MKRQNYKGKGDVKVRNVFRDKGETMGNNNRGSSPAMYVMIGVLLTLQLFQFIAIWALYSTRVTDRERMFELERRIEDVIKEENKEVIRTIRDWKRRD